jgi:pSer/pThr/pTyr-binding forkhead associated (FHA) protein
MQFQILMFTDDERKTLDLETPVVIGRSRQADVTLGHPLASRRHCEITEGDDNLLVIEDLGSLNGTVVGEERITEPVYLEPGDVFSVGDVTFQAVYGGFVPDEAHQSDVVLAETAEEDAEPAGEDDDVDFAAFLQDDAAEAPAEATIQADAPQFDSAEPADEEGPVDFAEVAEEAGDAEAGVAAAPSEEGQPSGFSWLKKKEEGGEEKAEEEDLDDFFKAME